MMEVIRAERETLSQLCAPVKLYPQELINVRVTDKDVAMTTPAVTAAAQEAEAFLAGRGRVLVRASGTEPVVRTLAEAPTDELCREANAFVLKAPRAASRLACSPRSGDADARHRAARTPSIVFL